MFKAYIDESGIHAGASMFVMASYLAPVKEWDRFAKRWQAILDKYGVKRFHASDCNSNRGEFKKFSDNREVRNTFVGELLTTISSRPRILAVNLGVVVDEFPDPHHRLVQPASGHPYYVCMKGLLASIHIVMSRWKGVSANEKVRLIFDRQDQFRSFAVNRFNELATEHWEGRDRFESIVFGSTGVDVPLQAADALAFDSYREFLRRRESPEKMPRPSYAALTAHKIMPQEWILDQREAAAFIQHHLDAERE